MVCSRSSTISFHQIGGSREARLHHSAWWTMDGEQVSRMRLWRLLLSAVSRVFRNRPTTQEDGNRPVSNVEPTQHREAVNGTDTYRVVMESQSAVRLPRGESVRLELPNGVIEVA